MNSFQLTIDQKGVTPEALVFEAHFQAMIHSRLNSFADVASEAHDLVMAEYPLDQEFT